MILIVLDYLIFFDRLELTNSNIDDFAAWCKLVFIFTTLKMNWNILEKVIKNKNNFLEHIKTEVLQAHQSFPISIFSKQNHVTRS